MNNTPEPRNAAQPKVGPMACQLCRDVPIAQLPCTCIEPCGPKCWYMEPDAYVPPAVPRFR